MSRLPNIDPTKHPELQEMILKSEEVMGFVSNDGLVMAHHPELLNSFFGLTKSILINGTVDPLLKRLMGLLVSNANGCTYCEAHSSNSASKYNPDLDKVKAVWEFEQSDLFSAPEKAALRVAIRSSALPNATSDDDIMQLQKHFTIKECAEIVGVISLYAFLNRWNSTLNTEIEAVPMESYLKVKVS